jgi:hypothetical protein
MLSESEASAFMAAHEKQILRPPQDDTGHEGKETVREPEMEQLDSLLV